MFAADNSPTIYEQRWVALASDVPYDAKIMNQREYLFGRVGVIPFRQLVFICQAVHGVTGEIVERQCKESTLAMEVLHQRITSSTDML